MREGKIDNLHYIQAEIRGEQETIQKLQLEIERLKIENASLKQALMESIKNAREFLEKGN